MVGCGLIAGAAALYSQMGAADFSVEGKTVLVTGAAMGMGKIYAQKAVAEKAGRVVLWDVNEVGLQKTAQELKDVGGNVQIQVVNVADAKNVAEAAAATLKGGKVDVLFNNAGIVKGKRFWEHDNVRDTELTMKINALGPMYITHEFLPAMLESQSPCRIINVASAAGLNPNPNMTVYCASKAAALNWSESLRIELEQTGNDHVKVTTVCPSYISTGMFDGVKAPLLTPILTPEYVTGEVWTAMKSGRPLLLMPWTVHFSMMSRGVLPVRAFDFMCGKIFGVYNTMDQFKGRGPEPTKK